MNDVVNKYIKIYGARENNLKNVDVTIPRDKMVVFTGLSGSGKSSLAFDTIYAEGHRRFVESSSSYARQMWTELTDFLRQFLLTRRLLPKIRVQRSVP